MMFYLLSDEFLLFQTVFLFLQLKQPMVVSYSYFLRMFLRMFSPFSKVFFTFSDVVLTVGFALINDI